MTREERVLHPNGVPYRTIAFPIAVAFRPLSIHFFRVTELFISLVPLRARGTTRASLSARCIESTSSGKTYRYVILCADYGCTASSGRSGVLREVNGRRDAEERRGALPRKDVSFAKRYSRAIRFASRKTSGHEPHRERTCLSSRASRRVSRDQRTRTTISFRTGSVTTAARDVGKCGRHADAVRIGTASAEAEITRVVVTQLERIYILSARATLNRTLALRAE